MRSKVKDQVDGRAYDLDGGALARDMQTVSLAVDERAMSATCVFSTGALDRQGDIVDVSGIRTENHRRNPVVMWGHGKCGLSFPIGKTYDPAGNYTVSIDGEVARQTTFFSQTLPEAEKIFKLIAEGIVCANSIGFENKVVRPIYNGGKKGLHVIECDLLEISWTHVPVNFEAVTKQLLEPKAWSQGVTLKSYAGRAAVLKSAVDFELLDDVPKLAEFVAENVASDDWEKEVDQFNEQLEEHTGETARLEVVLDDGEPLIEIVDDEADSPHKGLRFWSTKSKSTSGGRWITIGGKRGKDGVRAGGSPVYIENGRITRGAPSLTGRKIDALKEDAEGFGVRQANKIEGEYSRAKWGKQARAEGVEPKHLHQLAAEIVEHDKEGSSSLRQMLSKVKKDNPWLAGVVLNSRHGTDQHSIEPPAGEMGLDQIAQEIAESREFGHLFGRNEDDDGVRGDHSERLFDYLINGPPGTMDENDAYEQAMEILREHKISAAKVMASGPEW